MAARVLWKGAISFGLVHIPVRLHTATRDTATHFHLLSEDGTCRLRRRLVCPDTGEEFDFDRTARGFEVAPGQYVLVEDEELATLRPEKAHAIEIEDFVELSEIDPVYFDRSWWISPGEGGVKPYRLLVEALVASGKVGIARFVLRDKQSLVAVREIAGVLALSQVHWNDEVVQPRDAVEAPKAKVDARQQELALQLIAQLTRPWDPERYENTYEKELKALLKKKAAGQAIEVREAKAEPTDEVVDLQAALEASLRGAGRATEAPAPKKKRAAPKKPSTRATPAAKKKPASTRKR
jgi:DNA end-binding protein Ku